jgi:hypothetical protein
MSDRNFVWAAAGCIFGAMVVCTTFFLLAEPVSVTEARVRCEERGGMWYPDGKPYKCIQDNGNSRFTIIETE